MSVAGTKPTNIDSAITKKVFLDNFIEGVYDLEVFPPRFFGPPMPEGQRVIAREITDKRRRKYQNVSLLITDLNSPFQASGGSAGGWPVTKALAPGTTDLGMVVRLSTGVGTGNVGSVGIATSQTLANVTNITNPVTVKYKTYTGAITFNQITTTLATATLIVAPAAGDFLVVKNTDPVNSVDIGDSTVTYGAGYRLFAKDTVSFFPYPAANSIYAIDNGVNVVVVSFFQIS